jgi:hypothetical protein
MPAPYTGGCQCGAIRYEIHAEPLTLYVCHCTECQKQSSSAFGMSMTLPRTALKITQGSPKSWQRKAESGRDVACLFCGQCGTRLFHNPARNPDIVNVKPGTLDDTRWLKPAGHTWVQSAQPWVALPDDALCYERQPHSFADLIERFQNPGAN